MCEAVTEESSFKEQGVGWEKSMRRKSELPSQVTDRAGERQDSSGDDGQKRGVGEGVEILGPVRKGEGTTCHYHKAHRRPTGIASPVLRRLKTHSDCQSPSRSTAQTV